MDRQTTKPYVIVVAVDYGETGDVALQRAFELANGRSDAEPHVINVASSFGTSLEVQFPSDLVRMSLEDATEHLRQHIDDQLVAFEKTVSAVNFKRVVTHQRIGEPAAEIAQLASDLEADLVVTGTHSRRGLKRLALGSVAEAVVRSSPCPVLVVRAKEASAVPQIEPPCPECVATRRRTNGHELWCETHRIRHGRRHVYHYMDRNSGSAENMPLVVASRPPPSE